LSQHFHLLKYQTSVSLHSVKKKMNRILFILCFSYCLISYAQNVQVSTQTYTPQQLVEDILIDSNCIENINVTNVVGGDFGGTTQSYGYFEDGGSTFPF